MVKDNTNFQKQSGWKFDIPKAAKVVQDIKSISRS